MKDEEVLRQELEDVIKQKEKLLEEKDAILREAHLLKLRELQLKTLLTLEAMYQDIEATTPENFGMKFDLFKKTTAGKNPCVQVLIDFPKEEKEAKQKTEEINVIQEAVANKERQKQKATWNMPQLTEKKRYIIEIIGRKGISRNQELREFLEQDELGRKYFQKGEKFQYSDMSCLVKELKEHGYLITEKVNIGSKGGYNFHVYELSDLGIHTYEQLTKEQAVISEKYTMMVQHQSLAFGYLQKDCATEFKEMGYRVYTAREELCFELSNGKQTNVDLVLEKDGKKMFVQIDNGSKTEERFFEEVDGMYQLLQDHAISPAPFYYISPNESVLYGTTKRHFFAWVKFRLGGVEQVKGKITAHFTTFDKIKKHHADLWDTFEP